MPEKAKTTEPSSADENLGLIPDDDQIETPLGLDPGATQAQDEPEEETVVEDTPEPEGPDLAEIQREYEKLKAESAEAFQIVQALREKDGLLDLVMERMQDDGPKPTETQDMTAKEVAELKAWKEQQEQAAKQAQEFQQYLQGFIQTVGEDNFNRLRPTMDKLYQEHPDWSLDHLYDRAELMELKGSKKRTLARTERADTAIPREGATDDDVLLARMQKANSLEDSIRLSVEHEMEKQR